MPPSPLSIPFPISHLLTGLIYIKNTSFSHPQSCSGICTYDYRHIHNSPPPPFPQQGPSYGPAVLIILVNMCNIFFILSAVSENTNTNYVGRHSGVFFIKGLQWVRKCIS